MHLRRLAGIVAVCLVPLLVGVAPAAAAPTTWRSVPYPAGTGFLNGLSCATPSFCMAVGGTGTTPITPLTELWNGRRWSIVPSPVPPGTISSALGTDVSCPSPTFCMAIGNSTNPDFTGQPLTETWNGRRWSIVPSLSSPLFTGVEEVSSASRTFCVVVGDISQGRGTVAVWNGSSWTSTPTAPVLPPNEQSDLWQVSCATTRFCMATGYTVFRDTGTSETNYTVWDGSHWSSTPNIAIDVGSSNNLGGVSCTTTGHESRWRPAAVFSAASGQPLQTYSTTRTPQWELTPERTGVGGDISCTSERNCVASGTTGIQTWDGAHWAHAPGTSGFVFQVSCAGRSFCVAIRFDSTFTPSFLMRDGHHEDSD